ncbi:uncharacterized protein K452DRAFT_293884 [Aplosporella prunicola CBS 121167]|uniref:Uncharacterized protein n=1 Tax=Aplosporella prunicola CBS 121167 TaxID=1176127 RepID=A0A6A6BXA1_9PEZI|nr:uncharacterized protein K452DRAFT_293884 [Aplosporella prunicola CBS 121167]KAF2147474.1 hypothetical protein K452DRAFT_293884 [Aplosporella prunicola CBS 121167]
MAPPHPQDEVYAESMSDPSAFWARQAAAIHWHKPPTSTFVRSTKRLDNGVVHPHWTWFPGGEISTTYNCIDRHVLAGRGDAVAIFYDSPVTGAKERITYAQLLQEVEVLAGVLREEGVKKGDVVLIYMPMIPAALFAMLAAARLGAIHAVVFGGFSSPSLAQRIEASEPKAVLTASCGVEGTKGPLDYRPLVEGAVQKSSFKPPKIIVWQREQLRWDPIIKEKGERNWQRLVKSARNRGIKAEAVPVKSNDGLYIIYTSGESSEQSPKLSETTPEQKSRKFQIPRTTGLPKGVLREAGGHAVGLNFSINYMFGLHGPGDVMFSGSDIGWVVGHSYIVYAPLLAGASTVLFEGKPVGTPNAGTFWRIVEEYQVTTMFMAPTALRAIRREDGDHGHFEKVGQRGGLKSLTGLFLAGERSEPSIVMMYQRLLSRHCAPNAVVIDNWWSSETGSPISGLALNAAAGKQASAGEQRQTKPLPIKAGAAGKAQPGFDVKIVDDDGMAVEHGIMGNIVLGIPLAPTGLTTLWKDEQRFYKGYMLRFNGRWIDTGDAGMIDDEGYVHVMSRADDIINVAAHRFSTGAIEQAITSHGEVAEACVVGLPDAVKGHVPFAFVTLSTHPHPGAARPAARLFREVQGSVRAAIGPVASLGGMIQGKGMIPKTRSGKTLRRVLRELVEEEVVRKSGGGVERAMEADEADAVATARAKIREYFSAQDVQHAKL